MAACCLARRGNRRTGNEAKTTGRRPTLWFPVSKLAPLRWLRRRRRQRRRLLRQPLLQRADVLKQPRAGKTKKVEAEGRVLHIKLLDLVVADAENDARL